MWAEVDAACCRGTGFPAKSSLTPCLAQFELPDRFNSGRRDQLPRSRFEGQELKSPQLRPQDFSFAAAKANELQELERRPEYREFESFVNRTKGELPLTQGSQLAEIKKGGRKQAQIGMRSGH
jgi:hypothetical protein